MRNIKCSDRSKRYSMLLKVPRKFLIFHWLRTCQGSGVGSIPIGRSIKSATYIDLSSFPFSVIFQNAVESRCQYALRQDFRCD
jgi:hypothetical protein